MTSDGSRQTQKWTLSYSCTICTIGEAETPRTLVDDDVDHATTSARRRAWGVIRFDDVVVIVHRRCCRRREAGAVLVLRIVVQLERTRTDAEGEAEACVAGHLFAACGRVDLVVW